MAGLLDAGVLVHWNLYDADCPRVWRPAPYFVPVADPPTGGLPRHQKAGEDDGPDAVARAVRLVFGWNCLEIGPFGVS
jgi:hypothetical protein